MLIIRRPYFSLIT
ncbi:hypothetical protein YPPY64_0861, partial [Yersinia pestis PY-64]